MRMISLLILACAMTHAVAEIRQDELISSVSSPDGTIRFALTIDSFGSPRYTVSRGAETLVDGSRLGLRFETQAAFDQDLKLVGTSKASHDETWEQPWGERRLVRDRHEELLLQFADPEWPPIRYPSARVR